MDNVKENSFKQEKSKRKKAAICKKFAPSKKKKQRQCWMGKKRMITVNTG